eukprot:scaffold68_cov340-Pavlova_lutheri.AAC.33
MQGKVTWECMRLRYIENRSVSLCMLAVFLKRPILFGSLTLVRVCRGRTFAPIFGSYSHPSRGAVPSERPSPIDEATV